MSTTVITEAVATQSGAIDRNTGRMFTTDNATAIRAAGPDQPDPPTHPWVRRTFNLHPPMGFPHLDTQSSDLQEEVLPEEEAVADSQEEVTQEGVAVGSLAEEILEDMSLSKEIFKEDHWETDSSGMLPSSTMEIPRGQKNVWQHGNYTNKLTEGHLKWTTCIDVLCCFSLIYRNPRLQNGSIPSATGLNKQSKCPTNTTDDYGTIPKKCSSESLAICYLKNGQLLN